MTASLMILYAFSFFNLCVKKTSQLPYCHSGKVMPSAGSVAEWMMTAESMPSFLEFDEEGKSSAGAIESFLASIAEIIGSVACMEIENEAFLDFGSYLYRISAVIKELGLENNGLIPSNTTEILQSLARNVNFAKDLIERLQNCECRIQDSEVSDILEDLEDVMRKVGKDLSLTLFPKQEGLEFAQIAAKSLGKEMINVHFVVSKDQALEIGGLGGQEQSSMELSMMESTEIETDLYSINLEHSTQNLEVLNTTKFSPTTSIGSRNSINLRNQSLGSRKNINLKNYNSSSEGSLMSLPQMAQYMEPLYETFFCPLTNKIMDDPVTIESGITFDRTAIVEWFAKFESSEDIFCPKSRQKLKSRSFNANVALKATIDEWKERNEAAKIKVARAALSLASTENMILEAMDNLQEICRRRPFNKVQIRSIGIIPLLGKFLDYKSRNVRQATLELLQQLADDNDGKEMIARTIDALKVIKMLSSNHRLVRHASALLLMELSDSQFFCDKIGEISGGILMLITIKFRQSTDAFTSSKVDEILKNLEKSPANIKRMAEDGYWDPLLNHLIDGMEEMRMEMACYLGEIVLGPDSQIYVAEKSSSALINMVHSGNCISRSAAFKALRQISSYQLNSKLLVEAGIVQVMVEEMFARTIYDETINTKNEAAGILANILESGMALENLHVSVHGHTMTSDYIVYNIISRIKNSTPDDFNMNLIRILLCLMKFPESSATIVSVVKETEASYNLIELINTPNEELGIASIKLVITLASFMGHTLSDRVCKTKGQPESLIQNPTEIARITEKHAVSANLLAKLPHQNLNLNLALINRNTVPKIIDNINWIQRTGTRTSRYASSYFEGLVGTLVRFTKTLYDFQVLSLVREYNFTELFTEILMRTSSDEVQKLSAVGLENLSNQSVNLSKPTETKKNRNRKVPFLGKCFSFKSSKGEMEPLCPVHRGNCSSQNTFCLLDANAVERLLTCLDHDNIEVVKAALSAICTLLDDKVDVDMSVKVLHEMNAIRHVLNVVKEHREEALLQKSFWVIDKFIVKGGDESISDISEDRLFPATLISAFHHGDECTRQMAEKILRHLNKMPTFSINNFTL